ncbi:MAG: nicotinate-nucleotide adenylyltransferase [Actinomycetota bacterium]|nr:nicotinate-nucleotide adenylyltransferase [Actinomycetota bacterium]
MASIGILGGTFNPPHIGHLVMAQEAREQLGLARVVLMPVALPPHKEADGDPGVDVRLELARIAAAGEDGLEVSTVETDRGGASFTVDTLRELHERDPEQELTFIVGADMAHSLPAWRDPGRILELARLAVAEREGIARDDIAARLAPLHDGSRVTFFDMPRIDVSSSDIRRRVAEGRSVRHLVPDAVVQAIVHRDLYRTTVGRPAA